MRASHGASNRFATHGAYKELPVFLLPLLSCFFPTSRGYERSLNEIASSSCFLNRHEERKLGESGKLSYKRDRRVLKDKRCAGGGRTLSLPRTSRSTCPESQIAPRRKSSQQVQTVFNDPTTRIILTVTLPLFAPRSSLDRIRACSNHDCPVILSWSQISTRSRKNAEKARPC